MIMPDIMPCTYDDSGRSLTDFCLGSIKSPADLQSKALSLTKQVPVRQK
ncbi:hypothetical protein [Polymorphobacter megasporae]|nr:hypothetical protein [Polymorphobacter megasporae]UAJ12274.1 hypothetical protein KTC28_20820 [Polymorphobacter megasporae]